MNIAVIHVSECPKIGHRRVLVYSFDPAELVPTPPAAREAGATDQHVSHAHTWGEGFVDARVLPVLAAWTGLLAALLGVPIRWAGEAVTPAELPWYAESLAKRVVGYVRKRLPGAGGT